MLLEVLVMRESASLTKFKDHHKCSTHVCESHTSVTTYFVPHHLIPDRQPGSHVTLIMYGKNFHSPF